MMMNPFDIHWNYQLLESRYDLNEITSLLSFLEFEFYQHLRFVKIRFSAPVFDKVTKDRAAKFVDQLSAIGGTMGLLTGFSIISGVEIV